MRTSSRLRAVTTRVVPAVMALAACAGLAACGSSSSSSSSSALTPISEASGGPKGGPITAADVKTAQDFVGGKSGKATGTPIKVGQAEVLSGLVPAEAEVKVPQAAVKLINEKLGGIDGHPIQIVPCDTGGSDEKSQACGQQFANDSGIKAVINPGQVVGGLAMVGALQGKKLTFCGFATQDLMQGTNVLCSNGGVFAASSTITYLEQKVKAKKVSVIVPDNQLFKQIASISLGQMKNLGIQATPGYVPISSPDVTSALLSGGVKNADAIWVTLTSSSECIAVAKALKSLGVEKTPLVSLQTCNDPAVAKGLGGDIPKWTYFDVGDSAQLPNPSAQVKVFLDSMATYGGNVWGNWPTAAFGTTLWMAKLMNEVGADNLTTDALVAKAEAYTDPMFLGDPNIKFGLLPYPKTGSIAGRFFNYNGGGNWADATDGKWVPSPDAKQ